MPHMLQSRCWGWGRMLEILTKRGKVGERIEESAEAADLKARIYLITE